MPELLFDPDKTPGLDNKHTHTPTLPSSGRKLFIHSHKQTNTTAPCFSPSVVCRGRQDRNLRRRDTRKWHSRVHFQNGVFCDLKEVHLNTHFTPFLSFILFAFMNTFLSDQLLYVFFFFSVWCIGCGCFCHICHLSNNKTENKIDHKVHFSLTSWTIAAIWNVLKGKIF